METCSKVFCIGFQKTGTSSLHHYLKRLGYRSIHWPHVVSGVNYETLCIPVLHERRRVVDVFQPLLEAFDAFTDVPFPGLYRELFEMRPNSRFVMMERDPQQWWESLVRHWRLSGKKHRRLDPYEYLVYNLYSTRELECITVNDGEMMKDLYRTHSDSVRSFFRTQGGHLVVVNLEQPGKGDRISSFLGASTSRPFPKISRRSSARGAPSMGDWKS